jgi:hypothetical protein
MRCQATYIPVNRPRHCHVAKLRWQFHRRIHNEPEEGIFRNNKVILQLVGEP